jgi:hypothetical protein
VCGVDAAPRRHVAPQRPTHTTESGETVGGSSRGRELRSGRGSAEMISDGCSYANRKALVKGVGEHLLPTAQSVAALPAWPVGGGSRHRKLSYRPAGPLHSRSGRGHAAPRSVLWRRDEDERRDAW